MEDYKKYTDTELLIAYLDNELSTDASSYIEAKIASDPVLQSQMKELSMISYSVKSDLKALSPPPELTNNIFSNLGISDSSNKPFSIINSRASRFAIAALLLLLLSFVVAVQLDLFDSKSRNNNAMGDVNLPQNESHSVDVYAPEVSTELNNEAANSINAMANTQQYNNQLDNNRRSIDNKQQNIDLIQAAEVQFGKEKQAQVDIISKSNIIHGNELSYLNRENSYGHLSGFERNIMEQFSRNNGVRNRETYLNVRGVYSLSSDELKLQSSLGSSYIIGAFISSGVARNLTLGVEFGREPYSQIFLNSDFEQDPSVMWLGVGARYDFKEVSMYDIVPFAQVVAGGSELGPIARLFIGTNYITTSGIGFNLGIESSLMIYKNQNKYHKSDKIGLTGGVIYKF